MGRLYILHKDDLKRDDMADDEIVRRVNDITAALMAAGMHASARGDQAWLERHRWFGEACERPFADQPAVKLDG